MPSLSPPEQPLYILHQSIGRALIPKFVSLVVLGAIFYVGILLNISLLELTAAEETTIKSGALLFLILIIAFGLYLALRKAHQPYFFYRNRLVFNKKEWPYSSIVNTTPTQDMIDKVFKTYSINTGNLHIRNISQEVQLQPYLEQLIQYTKGSSTQPPSA